MKKKQEKEVYVYRLYNTMYRRFESSRSGKSFWASKSGVSNAMNYMEYTSRLIIKKYKLVEVVDDTKI